jgi:hypothetical protein
MAKSTACSTAVWLFAFYNSVLIQWLSYRLNVWETADSQQEQEIYLSLLQSIQTSPGTHQTSYPMGIRVISLRVKGRSAPLITEPNLVPQSRMSATICLVHTCLHCTYRDNFNITNSLWQREKSTLVCTARLSEIINRYKSGGIIPSSYRNQQHQSIPPLHMFVRDHF